VLREAKIVTCVDDHSRFWVMALVTERGHQPRGVLRVRSASGDLRCVSSTMIAKSYRLLPAILNTAVTEDELIIVNPCRIKGAGEERATERPC
jgi:hypothetical protein